MLSLINNSRVLTPKEHKIYDTLKRYMFTGKYSKILATGSSSLGTSAKFRDAPFSLSEEYPERDFQEWMNAFWAKDIQELFRSGPRFLTTSKYCSQRILPM